jgi:hypothetical protein
VGLFFVPLVRRLVSLAIFLAIVAGIGEFVARKLIGDAVKSAVSSRIGGTASVGFGSTPLLLQLAHGRLDDVTVSAADARFGSLPPVSVQASLRDVHMTSVTSLQGAIGEVIVHAHIGPVGVRDLLATQSCVDSLPGLVLGGLSAHPRVVLTPGQVELLPPRGRAVEVRFVPRAVSDAVYFALDGLAVDGREASGAELAAAGSRTACVRGVSALPFGLHLVHAAAEQGNVELELIAHDSSFAAIG